MAGVPDEVDFKTKTQIALDEIDGLLADGVAKAPIVMDAGYGRATELRDAIAERGMQYCGGDPRGDDRPVARPERRPRAHRGGRPGARAAQVGVAIRVVATRNEGRDALEIFTAARASREKRGPGRREERPLEWLLIEWPTTEAAPVKFSSVQRSRVQRRRASAIRCNALLDSDGTTALGLRWWKRIVVFPPSQTFNRRKPICHRVLLVELDPEQPPLVAPKHHPRLSSVRPSRDGLGDD